MRRHFNIYLALLVILILDYVINLNAAESGSLAHPKKFIITIIDTGIDLNNKTLSNLLWTNPGETGLDAKNRDKANNQIDDDGNGFIDDVHGWNFYDNSNTIQDRHGHGTHIAGIIYNELKKLKLEKQFCFQVVKYYDSDAASSGVLRASNKSFQYALENNSQLINYSGGGYEFSKDEEALVQKLKQNNIPLVAALGNQSLNTDLNPFYPASYGFDNVFAIGAAERSQLSAKFSNYGHRFLDFLTPGVQIESFGLNDTKTFLSGTSQSTATATALIAYLIFQEKGPIKWKDLKSTIKNLRSISHAKHEKENPAYIDITFISKHKTSAVDAFGDP